MGFDTESGTAHDISMPELFFTWPAQEGIRVLAADPGREQLLARVNEVLDLIEQEPGSADARRLRFREPPSWGIPVGYAEDGLLVTWMSGADFAEWADPEDVAQLVADIGDLSGWVVILYVGPRPD
jgi:hypothetical protein